MQKKVYRFSLLCFLLLFVTITAKNNFAAPIGEIKLETVANANARAAIFDDYIRTLYDEVGVQAKGLDYNVFKFAISGFYNLQRDNAVTPNKQRIAIIDFRKASQEKRLFIIDLSTRRLLHHTWVAHGRNSGLVYAQKFSNEPSSLQSSLGFYKTSSTYSGQHGYSLYLDGLESGFNDQARSRAIVMHGADYITPEYIAQHGRAGRSWGCPSIPFGEHTAIIDNLKMGNCLFIYSDDLNYLNHSKLLNFQKAADYYASQHTY